jgi:hypothetical protein
MKKQQKHYTPKGKSSCSEAALCFYSRQGRGRAAPRVLEHYPFLTLRVQVHDILDGIISAGPRHSLIYANFSGESEISSTKVLRTHKSDGNMFALV